MTRNDLLLKSCRAEFGALERLDGITPQVRGQRFNDLIARVLQAHGVHARANERNERGEIDVGFRINDKRFLLEAKWTAGPVDFDPVAKLGTRMDQRVGTDLGIVLSMSGFSADARTQAKLGGRPDVVLMGKDILDALLKGTIPAESLFAACLDVTAFEGRLDIQLGDIIKYLPHPGRPSATASGDGDATRSVLGELLRPTGDVEEFRVLFDGLPYGQTGVSVASSRPRSPDFEIRAIPS